MIQAFMLNKSLLLVQLGKYQVLTPLMLNSYIHYINTTQLHIKSLHSVLLYDQNVYSRNQERSTYSDYLVDQLHLQPIQTPYQLKLWSIIKYYKFSIYYIPVWVSNYWNLYDQDVENNYVYFIRSFLSLWHNQNQDY
jgi:hypothetical protein